MTAAEKSAKASAAAKKGWQTRWKKKALRAARGERERALNVLRALTDEDREAVLRELGGIPDVLHQHLTQIANMEAVRKQSVAVLKKYEEDAIKQQEKMLRTVEKITGATWVNAMSPEYIRRNGAIGIVPCAARYTLDSTTYWNIHVMMRQAVDEYGQDSPEIRDMATGLSQEYDISLREVWSILMSP